MTTAIRDSQFKTSIGKNKNRPKKATIPINDYICTDGAHFRLLEYFHFIDLHLNVQFF